DRKLDLLPAAHDPAGEKVTYRTRFRSRERVWPPIGDGRRVRAGATTAAPAIAVVPVQVGTDVARAGRGLAVLAPVVEAPVGDVGLRAVGVHLEDDPDLAGVDDVRDPTVRPVAVDEPVHDLQGHLDAHVLVGVVTAVVQHLGLAFVGGDVVRDLHRPD